MGANQSGIADGSSSYFANFSYIPLSHRRVMSYWFLGSFFFFFSAILILTHLLPKTPV